MKKLMFTLAFMLIGSIASANTINSEKSSDLNSIETAPPMSGSGTAVDSCGNEWTVEWSCGGCNALQLMQAIDAAIGDETGGDCGLSGYQAD